MTPPDTDRTAGAVGRAPDRAAFWIAILGLSLIVGVVAGRYSTTYIMPGLIGLAIVAIALLAPKLLLHALVLFLPFSFRFILPNHMELQVPSEPVVAALVGVFLLDRIVMAARRERVESLPFRAPILLFAAATLLSVTQSPSFFDSAKGALRSVTYMLFAFPVFAMLRDRRAVREVLGSAVVGGAAAALVMIFFLASRIGELRHTDAYEGTLFSNYAVYGAYMSVFLLPLLARTLFDNSYHKLIHWGTFAIFLAAMLFSLSRGAWLSLLAGAGFLLLQRSDMRTERKWAVVGASAGAFVLILLFPGVSHVVLERASTIADLNYASNRTRLLRWGFALLMFLDHPVIGGGYGSFALTYQNEAFLGPNKQYQMGAHSEHLQILAELGIVGFLAWGWLLVAFFRYGFRLLRRLDDRFWYALVAGIMAVQAAFVIHFVVGNFLAGDRFAVPFWFAFGALPAISRIAQSERASRDASSRPSAEPVSPTQE